MIILIAGASHTGKTALAQKMLEKYKYPYCRIAFYMLLKSLEIFKINKRQALLS